MRLEGRERILVAKLRYIGDVVLVTPLLRAIKTAYPDAAITVLVNKGTEDVLLNNPHVHEVVAFDGAGAWRLVRGLRSRRFDVALELTNSDRSAWICFLSGAKRRLGFSQSRSLRRLFLYNELVDASGMAHQIDRGLAIAAHLGAAHAGRTPIMVVTDHEASRAREVLNENGFDGPAYAVMHPGARRWYKRWPLENFAMLADAARDRGMAVVLTGSEEDRDLTGRIASLSGGKVVDLAGKTSIRELSAVISGAAAFVGNDSAPLHIASALGVKCIGLFGPTDWRGWGPVGPGARVFMKEGFTCRPCGHARECPEGLGYCTAHIRFEEVRDALFGMLDERPRA